MKQTQLPLPKPQCELGYPEKQAEVIAGSFGRSAAELWRWMNGQTMGICDGRSYDQGAKQYFDTGCGPHGAVVYAHDLDRFLARRPVID